MLSHQKLAEASRWAGFPEEVSISFQCPNGGRSSLLANCPLQVAPPVLGKARVPAVEDGQREGRRSGGPRGQAGGRAASLRRAAFYLMLRQQVADPPRGGPNFSEFFVDGGGGGVTPTTIPSQLPPLPLFLLLLAPPFSDQQVVVVVGRRVGSWHVELVSPAVQADGLSDRGTH